MNRCKSVYLFARPLKHRACAKIETFDRRVSIFPRGRRNLQRGGSVFARRPNSVAIDSTRITLNTPFSTGNITFGTVFRARSRSKSFYLGLANCLKKNSTRAEKDDPAPFRYVRGRPLVCFAGQNHCKPTQRRKNRYPPEAMMTHIRSKLLSQTQIAES